MRQKTTEGAEIIELQDAVLGKKADLADQDQAGRKLVESARAISRALRRLAGIQIGTIA